MRLQLRSKNRVEFIFSIVFIALAIILNLQFLDGSNINHTIAGHDEYIAVKEIYSILQPESFKHWIMAVVCGNALYYGRIMFYFDALIAFIPFLLFGIKGMVLTVRLVHSLLILVSLIMLAETFLQKPYQRLLFYIGTFCLYYSLYFIMMPKPEPHQLLCLALFLNRFKKNEWTFTWHFIFLGIAYGLKFNIILILPLIFILPLVKIGLVNFRTILMPGIKSLGFFIAGILIAIPCLILTPIKPAFLQTYLHETFGGTNKIYDDASLNLFKWLIDGFGGSYFGCGNLAIPFSLFIIYCLIVSIKNDFKTKDFSASILLFSGFILCALIMIKTKRLWPHYLWTGYILSSLGIIVSISQTNKQKLRKMLYVIMSSFIGSSVYFFLKRELPLYLNLSTQPDIVEERRMSIKVINYIKLKYPESRIGTDGSLLYPFEDFVSVDIYHPFTGTAPDRSKVRFYWYSDFPEKIWDDNNDIVVFYKRHPNLLMLKQSNFYKEKQDIMNKLLINKTLTDFSVDTTFERIIIFKRK